ncbi:MAG: cysteine--tRNA ligase [Candidatus Omnitrophica bacterium]|nr:cysteine--tRNA ligase [Candidatus Omnitrophota bacterium]
MSIYIYNSLTRKKEEFIPLKAPLVNLYTCGVTVYDDCHIGHARSLYIFGVVRRYLASRGFKVCFVRNITDIDDKIINRAKELKTDWKELVGTYINRYHQDLDSLGIEKADYEPRATENIPEMIRYISVLIEKQYAYATPSGVYFNVRKFTGYGKLSGQSIDQMQTGARIESDETKQDPLDFALWKASKNDEPFWESPWGKGRPGWHIECSVMSQKFLKVDTLDIHAGGRDLIFPHHENETAQAEALTDRPFAKYWIHHGLLTINAQKMSKSLGNFVTIKDFMQRYGDADLLKLFFLSAHYAHPIDYTEEKIEEATRARERIMILKRKMAAVVEGFKPKSTCQKITELKAVEDKFLAAMDDDFNTPEALASVFELVTITNKNIENEAFVAAAKETLRELTDILGLQLAVAKDAEEAPGDIEALISKRDQARKNKDFAESDRIRKELEARGIILEDSKDGKTVWRRKL